MSLLLAVLPGTGGLTRVTDKRKVRRDLADAFCTIEEGVKGSRAVKWRLVDEVAPNSRFDAAVARMAEALTATSPAWSSTPEDQLVMRRYARAIDARLQSVSDWQAEVFFLRHVEDLPIREISRRTMRSSDAIRSGLYRVKRLLVEAGEFDSATAGT